MLNLSSDVETVNEIIYFVHIFLQPDRSRVTHCDSKPKRAKSMKMKRKTDHLWLLSAPLFKIVMRSSSNPKVVH